MKSKSRLVWLLAACAVPAACTFGADDFKVVSADGTGATPSGGSINGNGGDPSNAGGINSNAGVPNVGATASVGGAATGGGAAGEGGGGGDNTLPLLTCATRNNAVVMFKEADFVSADGLPRSVDEFHLTPATINSAYGIAVGNAPNGAAANSIIGIRRLTDSMDNALGSIKLIAAQGFFRWGGAYATAQAAHVIGTDERGIVDIAVTVTANGQFSGNEVVRNLEIPGDCTNVAGVGGSVRDLVTSYDGTLSYAVTCAGPNGETFSLYVHTPEGTLDPVPDTGPEIGRIVRQFVHSKDGTMLLATGDEFGPHVDMRFGRTAADLAKAHPFTVEKDDTLARGTLLLPQADDSGVFLSAFLVHVSPNDPSALTPPLVLMGGTFRILDYPTLSDQPPALLTESARYTTTSADIIMPAGGAVRAKGDVVLVGNNPLKNDSISAWVVGPDGQLRSNVVAVHPAVKNVVSDRPSGALVGLGMAVAWRQIEADGSTANIMLRSVSCL